MRKPNIRFWQGHSGLWYIQVVATNGRIVLDGGQGYKTKGAAKKAAERVKEIVGEAVITDDFRPVG